MTTASRAKLIEYIKEQLEKEDLDQVVFYATNGENHQNVMSFISTKGAGITLAMIGMLIKILANQMDKRSDELANIIAEELKEAEEKTEEMMNKKRKGEKIQIKITDLND